MAVEIRGDVLVRVTLQVEFGREDAVAEIEIEHAERIVLVPALGAKQALGRLLHGAEALSQERDSAVRVHELSSEVMVAGASEPPVMSNSGTNVKWMSLPDSYHITNRRGGF